MFLSERAPAQKLVQLHRRQDRRCDEQDAEPGLDLDRLDAQNELGPGQVYLLTPISLSRARREVAQRSLGGQG